MVYVVVKQGKGHYVVRNRYTEVTRGLPCSTHGEAQSRADRLNRGVERTGRYELREMAEREG